MNTQSWQDVLTHLFERYEKSGLDHFDMLVGAVGPKLAARALNLCKHAQTHINQISEDKANRWLGFVQGVLCAAEILDVDTERDYTRPLFHGLKGVSASHAVSDRLDQA